ncbi:DegT/DnrJ/EryC1/StrS family aminotransferase [Streptosporangium vulgare]|uniref:DegT/DnrJ/EryC1/StrS family aminotransferase n=1 Tax=Streptosporangium vulgare TaxID=46190 RepID=A0ABV5TBQ0_9ACTN
MTSIDRFHHLGHSPVDPVPGSPAPDQAVRNGQVRRAVARLAATRRVTLRVRSTRRQEGGEPRVDHYLFEHEGRRELRAVMLAPPGPGPWPAVLVCAGRNATLERVTGLLPPDHPGRDVAAYLTGAGFLTLTLDHGLDGWAEPAALGGRDPGDVLDGTLRLRGGSLLGALAEDAGAALDWLRAHPDVAPGRVGLFGHSMGAAVALHAALLREEPLPLCAASHLGTYETMIGRSLAWNQYVALPSILRHADLPDLYAALAPAPLQIQYGTADGRLDPGDAKTAGERIAGAHETAEILPLPMGHGTGLAEAADFFTRSLAPARSPDSAHSPAGPAAGTPGAFVAGTPDVPAAKVGFDVRARLDILDLVDDALASGALTLGARGARLEALASREIGRGTAAVSSGSSALEIALRIVGVEGRTVLVPANTFFATAASAVRAGARVGFVDLEPDGLGMDPAGLRAALAAHEDVAAVVPVHIAGVVAPSLAEVLAECDRQGVAVVEDAAHALGSSLHGRQAGTFGRLAAFSLYPTKIITSGEGGLLSADGADLKRVTHLRDHGKRSFEENLHDDLGSNWRMSELHAAVGLTHLARLAEVLAERTALAARYDESLAGVPSLTRPAVPEGCASNHYKYLALLPEGVDRAALKQRLRAEGVRLAGEVYDVPLHRQPYFARRFGDLSFPRAEAFASRHICLPLFPGMTDAQQERVVRALRDALS